MTPSARRTATRKHTAKVAAKPNRPVTTVIRAPEAPPKDWFDTARARDGGCNKHLEGVMMGNQVIFRLSAGPTAGNPKPYFIVQDPTSTWWYLVWDLNTPGGPFHGKYRKRP